MPRDALQCVMRGPGLPRGTGAAGLRREGGQRRGLRRGRAVGLWGRLPHRGRGPRAEGHAVEGWDSGGGAQVLGRGA